MLSNISDLFTMASLAICMLLSGIIFYYLRTRINMLEQSVMEQAQLLQQVLRHSQNQQQLLQQQQIATMATASTTATTAPNSLQQQQQQQRLIPVSDDSDSDDSDDDSESDDSDSDDSDDSESDDDGVNLHHSKSIDLSALTSVQIPLMSSTFFENGGSNTEIKVIELKHYFNGNNDGTGDNSDSGSESGSESGSDSDSCSDSDSGSDSGSDDGNDKGNGSSNNNESKNVDNKKQKHFEKIKKGAHTAHSSLDVPVPLKSMPVNMLRDLAKTKLTHLEQPAINKMSKKEILKALDK
jgi:heme exporter protein D